MSFGVVNAYFAGAGKLGSALGRDGDLPKFMAKGSEPDAVPRRSLIIMFIISSGSLTLMTFNDFRIDTILTLQISGMVCVYVVGMIAATRIFERWTRPWWVAVISVPLTAMLLIFAGANLLFPLAGVIGAVTVSLVKRIRSRRSSRVSDL
jgi:amino acid efflux transporter